MALSSVSVNRLVVIFECDAPVIVDAIPREKTWKQGRIVIIVATITAVKISDMARVLGVVLYPGSVMRSSGNQQNEHTMGIRRGTWVGYIE